MAFGEEIAYGIKIAERLGHFLTFNEKMLGVKPVARKRLASSALTLRDFVFVMRESEIDAAGMNVQGFTEIFHGHGRTFDVPARAARADFRFPKMFTGFRRFP